MQIPPRIISVLFCSFSNSLCTPESNNKNTSRIPAFYLVNLVFPIKIMKLKEYLVFLDL